MTGLDVVTRPVLAAAWDAAQRRAGETGLLNVSPPAQAGSMLESMGVQDAITVALIHVGTWTTRGETKTANWWREVGDELKAVAEQDARAKEGRGAA